MDIASVASVAGSSVSLSIDRSGSVEEARVSVGHETTSSIVQLFRGKAKAIFIPLSGNIRSRRHIFVVKRDVVIFANAGWGRTWGAIHWWQFIAFTGDREVVRHLVPHNINVVATEGRNDRVVGRVEVVVVDVYRGMGPSLNARGSVTERGLRDDDILLVTASVTVGDRICGCYPVDRTIHGPLLS